jgi:hypothetical protein
MRDGQSNGERCSIVESVAFGQVRQHVRQCCDDRGGLGGIVRLDDVVRWQDRAAIIRPQ